mmetsp:Transcript_132606/g.369700  ORF Transcript_132606/g.369700 Transcript_132606/m.369700 type:complete len:257 (+) Transcript_132606:538-1308(+)
MAPSFSARTRARMRPAARSRTGASRATRVSPASSLRTALDPLISSPSVRVVACAHWYCGDQGCTLFAPSVNQPSPPLLRLRPFTRFGPSFWSAFGPSSTSRTSPSSSVRSLLLPVDKLDSRVTLRRQMWCLVVSSTYAVPRLPFMVTQPSLPSFLALALTRVRVLTESSLGPSTISSVSPTSSLLSALPSVMSNVVVITMLCLHTSSFADSRFMFPWESLSVTQPVLPSLALPRTRCVSTGGSFCGPARTSMTSPT